MSEVKLPQEKYPEEFRFSLLRKALDEDLVDVVRRLVAETPDKKGLLSVRDLGYRAMREGRLDIAKFFVENCPNDTFNHAWPIACFYGKQLEFVKFFFDKRPPNQDEKDGIFYHASCAGDLDTVKYLIEECKPGANIHFNNDSAIIYAAYNGHFEMVKYLISVGADPRVKNDKPLRLAARNGHLKVVEYLIEEHNADIFTKKGYALLKATVYGSIEMIRYLVEVCKLDHTVTSENPLFVAAMRGNLEIVDYFVSKGFPLQDETDSALRKAAVEGHIEIVKYLVEGCRSYGPGADIRYKNNIAIVDAIKGDYLEIANYLIEMVAEQTKEYPFHCK